MLIEKWKDIEDYEDLYKISTKGIIESKGRVIYKSNGEYLRTYKPKVMKLYMRKYYYVGLNKNKIQTHFSLHRLLAIHFIANPNNYPHINHKDGNKLNNDLDNLEWCTPSQNNKHAYDTGLKKPTWLGKKMSKESCDKMSKSRIGSIPWNKGIRQKPPTHGTMTEYNYGCRCDLCKAENTRYCRVKREKNKEDLAEKVDLVDKKYNELNL